MSGVGGQWEEDGGWIVVSDLDGCLLDGRTYSWEPARGALEELRRRAVPVVLCTSKTLAETLPIQEEMGLAGPLIVEDGCGIAWPEGLEALARPYPEVRELFLRLKRETGGALRGFGDLSDEELAAESGLSLPRASLARRRDFDEPFRFLHDEKALLPLARRRAGEWGLQLRRGGRYWHLHGPADKGRAARRVLERHPRRRSVGLGDAEVDLPLLQAVDAPVVVARSSGEHDPVLAESLPAALRAAPGPEGWSEAIAALVLVRGAPASS